MKKELTVIKNLTTSSNPATVQEAVDTLSDFVNKFGYEAENLAYSQELGNDPLAAETFDHICLAWIDQLAKMYQSERYDLRNEAACAFGYKAIKNAMVSAETNTGSIFSLFANQMARERRTLQQSFTSLTLTWMKERVNFNLFFSGILNATTEDQHMPLI